MQGWQSGFLCLRPGLVIQPGEKTELFPADGQHSQGVSGDSPAAVFVLDSGNRPMTMMSEARLHGLRMIQISDMNKSWGILSNTEDIQTEFLMMIHFGEKT